MLRTRLIPCLLVKDEALVKTVRFRSPRYIGDPVNAVRIFNDKEVDELILLDITATVSGKPPSFELIAAVAGECFMPLCYGGGIRSVGEMRRIFELGVEKIAVNTQAVLAPSLIPDAAREFGSQSVVGSIDVKRTLFGRETVRVRAGRQNTGLDPVTVARMMEKQGAGELLLTSIDAEGSWEGLDLQLIEQVTKAVSIPVVASGGTGSLAHLREAVDAGASAVAIGSMAVLQRKGSGVLVGFPTPDEIAAALVADAAASRTTVTSMS